MEDFIYYSDWEMNQSSSFNFILWELELARGRYLTHRGPVLHICVGKLTIIGSDNGLSPGQRQASIWTNAGILLIGPLGTNLGEISIDI